VLGWLRAKKPEIALPAIYALAGATCLGILWFTFTGHGILVKTTPKITPDNVEESITKWAYSLGLGVTKPPSGLSDGYFADIITLKSGTPVQVIRVKELPDYIQFSAQLTLSPDHQKALSELDPKEQDRITDQILIELARMRIGNTEFGQPNPNGAKGAVLLQNIIVSESIPLDELTKDEFVKRVDSVDSGSSLVRATTALALDHAPPHVKLRSQ